MRAQARTRLRSKPMDKQGKTRWAQAHQQNLGTWGISERSGPGTAHNHAPESRHRAGRVPGDRVVRRWGKRRKVIAGRRNVRPAGRARSHAPPRPRPPPSRRARGMVGSVGRTGKTQGQHRTSGQVPHWGGRVCGWVGGVARVACVRRRLLWTGWNASVQTVVDLPVRITGTGHGQPLHKGGLAVLYFGEITIKAAYQPLPHVPHPPHTRSTSAPYASSFFAPIPLIPCKSATVRGHCWAMAASVAS